MGGCATKPKVFKGGDEGVPDPGTPRQAVSAAKEEGTGDVVVVADADDKKKVIETDEVAKEKDVINDNNVDDQSNKESRSLSNLFNKEKEKDVTTESDDTQSEPVLQESPLTVKQESSEPLKQQLGEPVKIEAVTVNQETKEPEKPMEPESGFPGNIGSDQPVEAKSVPEAEEPEAAEAVTVTETQSKETSAGEKKDKAVVEN